MGLGTALRHPRQSTHSCHTTGGSHDAGQPNDRGDDMDGSNPAGRFTSQITVQSYLEA